MFNVTTINFISPDFCAMLPEEKEEIVCETDAGYNVHASIDHNTDTIEILGVEGNPESDDLLDAISACESIAETYEACGFDVTASNLGVETE
jgi:hypothetical protein